MNALELLKAQAPGADSLVLIIGDAEAQRVMMAWTHYKPKHRDLKPKPKEAETELWTRLWNAVVIDFEELSKIANVPATRCERMFYRLKRSNLVYPDGTIAGVATQLLNGQMMAHIRGFIARKNSARA